MGFSLLELHTKAVVHGATVPVYPPTVEGVAVQVVVELGLISMAHQRLGESVVWGFTFPNSI